MSHVFQSSYQLGTSSSTLTAHLHSTITAFSSQVLWHSFAPNYALPCVSSRRLLPLAGQWPAKGRRAILRLILG